MAKKPAPKGKGKATAAKPRAQRIAETLADPASIAPTPAQIAASPQPAPGWGAPAAPTAPINYTLLMQVAKATNYPPNFMYCVPDDAAPLLSAGLVECNYKTGVDDKTGQVMTRITDLGKQAIADQPADAVSPAPGAPASGWGAAPVPPQTPAPPAPAFSVGAPPPATSYADNAFEDGDDPAPENEDADDGEADEGGDTMPPASYAIDASFVFTRPSRAARTGSRMSKYPFDNLLCHASFHVPYAAGEDPDDQLRRIKSAVSIANKRHSVPVKDAAGNTVTRTIVRDGESIEVPQLSYLRKFAATHADATDPQGAGIRVGRYI
jgi:hypothetical protein